ncbi:DUF1016 N-terminal domain-containing protein [Pedobacter sp. P26]|uniref:DUF1016 N-terminal domain-containing protein n=1 Tax=Pedobacter sp. P26 TaxID=3423956 RepID=UPI003D679A88
MLKKSNRGKERAEYGKQILNELSEKLVAELGKGFSKRNLEQMRQFYLTYSIAQTVSAQLEKIRQPLINSKMKKLPTLYFVNLKFSRHCLLNSNLHGLTTSS